MPRPPAKEERKQYGLKLSTRLMREVRHLAIDEDKNMNDLVEEALEELLRKYRGKRKG